MYVTRVQMKFQKGLANLLSWRRTRIIDIAKKNGASRSIPECAVLHDTKRTFLVDEKSSLSDVAKSAANEADARAGVDGDRTRGEQRGAVYTGITNKYLSSLQCAGENVDLHCPIVEKEYPSEQHT